MTLLSRAVSKIVTTRVPLTPQASFAGINVFGMGGASTSQIAQLEAYGQVGWLYGVVSRIAESVSQATWHLYEKRGQERREIEQHPFLDLWDSINDFYTREEFLEASQQHLDLPGETFWLVITGPNRLPIELWPIRPDRIRVVPSREKYIAGYIYTIGGERIPLDVDDIIHLKRPNPMDPYRGLGPVGALMADIHSEHMAAQWTGNFFKNGATPGGYIEFPDDLSDQEFDRFVLRWREQHQGVNNAHRVAVLERAKYHEVKYSMRDMQNEQLRRMNRDIILGAYGFPHAILGITEDVNRANAEAAEVMFSRWVIRPRLVRLRGAVNERLLKRFGDNLLLDFDDPVPQNREINRVEAVEGYAGEILTKNEARRLLGHDDVPDGDVFKERALPAALPGMDDDEDQEKIYIKLRKAGDPLLTSAEERAEADMRRAWERRLEREANILADILDPDVLALIQQVYSKGAAVEQHIIDSVLKVELTDIDAYSFDWWDKYSDEVIAELTRVFEIASLAAEPEMSIPVLQQRAAEYARHRGAELLRLDGDVSLSSFTRKRVQEAVARAIEEGLSLGQLQKTLREDIAFSAKRAETIARTETATALGQGAKQASLAQGRDEKHWYTQGDDQVDDIGICNENAAQGWIKLSQAFQSGHDTIPGHPKCRCNVIYRTAALHDDDEDEDISEDAADAIRESRPDKSVEIRCPKCRKRLPINGLRGSADVYCNRCDEVFKVGV